MSTYTDTALERLPAPQIIDTPAFEPLFDQTRAAIIEAMPELASVLMLESESATKMVRVFAYLRILDRIEFNDRARGNLAALATGADLEHLAAAWGVFRLTRDPGNPDALPPVPPTMESDTDLRRRMQLALEGFSTAGPRGAYEFHALTADGRVRDVAVTSPVPGQVLITVLSTEGDGTPSQEVLELVKAATNDENVRPLNDTVTPQPVELIDVTIAAELTLYEGPAGEVVLAAAQAALADHLDDHRMLGHDITTSGLIAALYRQGVHKVILTSPAADVVIAPTQAARFPNPHSITIGGRDV